VRFRGNLLRDGRVILRGIEGAADGEARPDGRRAWSGHFLIPPGQSLRGGAYALDLDGGWSTTITLSSVAAGRCEPALVRFTGTAPPA
jgi:hypothetical protein